MQTGVINGQQIVVSKGLAHWRNRDHGRRGRIERRRACNDCWCEMAGEHEETIERTDGGPSRLFILRPVATTLSMLAILLAGLVAFRVLPLSALPEVDYPTIQVRTLYPGASPDVMAVTVTGPLERQFGRDGGAAAHDLGVLGGRVGDHAAILARSGSWMWPNRKCRRRSMRPATLLPSDLPAPPIYAKVNPADAPIVSFGVTSASRPLAEVQNLVDQRIANKLSQISGVGLVNLSGGQRPAVRLQANVPALAARGLSLDTLRTVIAPPTSTVPRAASTGRRARGPSTPTISSRRRRSIAI